MGHVRVLSIEDDGSSTEVCRLISDDGGPVYAKPNNVWAITVLGRPRIPGPNGDVLTTADGDKYLAELHRFYSGSRMQVTELEGN